MRSIFIIRIKALFLSVIFASNFFAICPCAASAVASTSAFMRMNGNYTHRCCRQKKTIPCKDAKGCPRTQAVKFNLLEKKAAGTVEVGPAGAIGTLGYLVPVIEGRLVRVNISSWCLPPHAPADRLALYHCWLI
jgi:hypothetical protein